MKVALCASACLALVGCAKGAKNDAPAAATSHVSTSAAAAPAAAALPRQSTRKKLACRELLKQMEETSKRVQFEVKTTPGSWGKVPAALQKLPPGGEHCGAVDLMDQAIIASGLAGKELEAFYAPLFAKLGCQPFRCEDATSGDKVQTRCQCRANGYFGTVNTDTGVESYSIGVVQSRMK